MPRIEIIIQYDGRKQIKRIAIFCEHDYDCNACPDRDICDAIYDAILNTKYAEELRMKEFGGKNEGGKTV